MGNIHCHTFCNFSAIAAAELSVGLFVDKDPWLHTAFPVSAESEKQRFELCGYSSSFLKDIDRTALQKRDWVLQERLLSPRTVFFGDQLSWGCMESRANETFPGGLPSYTPGPGNFNSFKLDNLCGLHGFHSSPVCNAYAFSRKIVYRLWRTVINRHTQCDLTFENDVFPALSGLARIFKEFLEVTYLVGLWKGSLYANLIWKRSCNPYLKSGRGPVQTATYRAPSWSWISIKGPSGLFFEPRYDGNLTELTEILQSTVTLASDDPYGQALDGRIRMQGYLKPAKSHKSSKNLDTPLRHEGVGEWFDDGYYAHRCRWTTGASFLSMLYYSAHEYNNRQWLAKIVGLVLEEVVGRNLTYRRVGLFHHLHRELCDK